MAQELEQSCGAACARQLLLDVDIDVPEIVLREHALFDPAAGIYCRELAATLTKWRGARFVGGVVQDEPEALLRLVGAHAPMIVLLERHWVIIDRVASDFVDIRDPAPSGAGFGFEGRMARAELLVAWQAGHWQAIWRTG